MDDEDTETLEDADAVQAEVDDLAASAVVAPPEPVDELAPGGTSGHHGNGSGG